MSAERVTMRKIKDILRLKWACGLSNRQVAASCGVARSTVAETLYRATAAGLSWPLPEELDDAQLETRLYPAAPPPTSTLRAVPDWATLHQELTRNGVTLALLWQEYKAQQPDGYQYSRFCDLYGAWHATLDRCLRQEHRAGEKLFVDYAGQTVPVQDRTGEMRPAQIFVADWGASNYTYAEATWTQTLPDWIGSHVRAFAFFGGVPQLVVPDNLRSGVTKACRYEPELNPTYADLTRHYGVAVIPARGPQTAGQGQGRSGRAARGALDPGPAAPSALLQLGRAEYRARRVPRPPEPPSLQKAPRLSAVPVRDGGSAGAAAAPARALRLCGVAHGAGEYRFACGDRGPLLQPPLALGAPGAGGAAHGDDRRVFPHKHQRVASHVRSAERGRHTTVAAHLPSAHQRYLAWSPSRLIQWADTIGPATAAVVDTLLTRRRHPEQGYRSCLGVLRLECLYGPAPVEAACRRAQAIDAVAYKSVQSILKTGLDQQPLPEPVPTVPLPIAHDHLRGTTYYQHHEGGV
jgi:transposase